MRVLDPDSIDAGEPAAIVGIGALLATAVFPRVSPAKRAALAAPPEPPTLEERG